MKNLIKIAAILLMLTSGSLGAQNNLNANVVTEDGQSTLQWSTAKETNSSYFLIESSEDGVDYAPAGQVKAAGYSMSSKAYEFTTESRSRFYRVSMVGMDGGRMTSVAVSPLQDANQNGMLTSK